jgi:hypothetical protein
LGSQVNYCLGKIRYKGKERLLLKKTSFKNFLVAISHMVYVVVIWWLKTVENYEVFEFNIKGCVKVVKG